MRHSTGTYPSNWNDIATQVKTIAGWRCIRCGHPHDPKNGYCLTVHHLDFNPSNNAWWNLLALCQRCHLHIQSQVIVEQIYMFEHSDWIKPYLAGYYANKLHMDTNRPFVLAHLDYLLCLGGD